MLLLVKVNQYNDVSYLDNANGYILANRNFSYRFEHSFTLNEIQKINSFCKKTNKKIFLLVNRIFKDKDLADLENYLLKTFKYNIDGYLFADFAVFMILKKYHKEDKAVFYHETFLRNSYDIKTYQKYGINKIICSKDMHIDDIKDLDENKKDSYGILAFGYYPIYESSRKLVTNFTKTNNLDSNLKDSLNLTIKEQTRNEKYRIIEQAGISSIFASNAICLIEYTKQLLNNLDMFIIDSLFFDKEYIKKVLDLFYKSQNETITIEDIISLNNNASFDQAYLNKRVGLVK